MAVGWLTVLKMVPWTDVISNAPVVADGAKKLWKAVAKKTSAPEVDAAPANTPFATSSDAPTVATLQQQLAATQAAVSDLRQQMLASSELIQALAEQNTQLIERVEINRARLVWLARFTAVLALVVIATQVGPWMGI